MNIGQRIKQRRNELNMSQRELAKRMGYQNHSTITKIEAGSVDIPQSKIIMFAQVLNTTEAFLMGWEEMQKNNGIIVNAVNRMRRDPEFLSVVNKLGELDAEQFIAVKSLLSAFSKVDK